MKYGSVIAALVASVLALTLPANGQTSQPKKRRLFELPSLSIGRSRAVRAEKYELTRDAGPYMVLVTTFLGPAAKENALKLARELREEHGIEAYIYVWNGNKATSGLSPKRLGWFSRMQQVAVLAGNFDSMDGEAQRTLRAIKRLRPKTLKDQGPFPLRGAILVCNPLIPPSMRPGKPKRDKLLAKINQGPYNIVHCKGKYTIQVAVWTGQILVGPEAEAKDLKPSQKLYEAASNAEELVRILRKAGYEAYVFHGRQASAVTVGSFDRTDDPRIGQLIQQLAGKKFGKHQLLKAPVLVHVPRI